MRHNKKRELNISSFILTNIQHLIGRFKDKISSLIEDTCCSFEILTNKKILLLDFITLTIRNNNYKKKTTILKIFMSYVFKTLYHVSQII